MIIRGIRKIISAFEIAIFAIETGLNNYTTKTQNMEFEKEKLEKKYNHGLAHGLKYIRKAQQFQTIYPKLLKEREHLPKDLYDAFQAGLQDGFHNHGQSHFDEWFKYEFLPSKKIN